MDELIHTLKSIGWAVLWSFVGLGLFGLAFFLINWISPVSIRKEIEDDQNTSLGIVIGAVMIGIAIIVAAAIR
jgi:uncharacterized membrane protein YjfL (UPF0719 family)